MRMSKEEMLRIKEEAKGMLEWYLQSQGINTKKNFSCLSADHNDSNPSMTFNKNNNTVYCFGCGEHGDIFDVIRMQYGIPKNDYKTIFETTYRVLGINVNDYGNEDNHKSVVQKKQTSIIEKEEKKENELELTSFFKKAESQINQTDYAKKRGLSEEVIKRFHLGFVPEWINPKLDEETKKKIKPTPRLIIPTSEHSYLARSTKENLSDTEKKYAKIKVGKVRIFNEEALWKANSPVFITEGEIDAMSIMVAGGEAVALGSAANVDLFVNECKKNPPKNPLIICPDNDETGKKAMTKLGEKLHKEKIPFVCSNINGNYKDANERLVKDSDGFKNHVRFVRGRITKIFDSKNKVNFKEEFEMNEVENNRQEAKEPKILTEAIAEEFFKGYCRSFGYQFDGSTYGEMEIAEIDGEKYAYDNSFAAGQGTEFYAGRGDAQTLALKIESEINEDNIVDKFYVRAPERELSNEKKEFYVENGCEWIDMYDADNLYVVKGEVWDDKIDLEEYVDKEFIDTAQKYQKYLKQNDLSNAYDTSKKLYGENSHLKFMKDVIKEHGAETKTLHDAIQVVANTDDKPTEFVAILLNDTLKTKEYRKAFEEAQGKTEENTR
ncbi:MAG: toprim domain-containing protein [Selenomonadaceae bacterium]|nr:toprim domain-containing protein [Selenomonadaceae bacterium]